MSGCVESDDSQRGKLGRQVVCASRGTSAGHLPSTRAYPAHWIAKRGHSRARAHACTGPARIEVAYFGAIGGGVHVHTRRLGLLWGGRALVRLPQTVSTGTSGAYWVSVVQRGAGNKQEATLPCGEDKSTSRVRQRGAQGPCLPLPAVACDLTSAARGSSQSVFPAAWSPCPCLREQLQRLREHWGGRVRI